MNEKKTKTNWKQRYTMAAETIGLLHESNTQLGNMVKGLRESLHQVTVSREAEIKRADKVIAIINRMMIELSRLEHRAEIIPATLDRMAKEATHTTTKLAIEKVAYEALCIANHVKSVYAIGDEKNQPV